MDARARAEAIVRTLLAFVDAPIRVAYARDQIARVSPKELAPALDRICARAEQAEPRAREALVALVDAIGGTDAELRDAVQLLREEAAGESLLALERLLRHPPAPSRPPIPKNPNAARPPDYGHGRPLTLGERKSLARRHDRDLLTRLFADPHPDVIARLLKNPHITEDDVMRLAAKRPCRADVLAEIARAEKWMHRSSVRLALVLNPSTPVEIAVPIVGLLMRQELKMVIESTHVAAAVRAVCVEHLERRPPGAPSDPGAPVQ